MAIAIIVTDRPTLELCRSISGFLNENVVVKDFRDFSDFAAIEMAVVWKHPEGILSQFPNLKVVTSLGAGVEHLLRGSFLPDHLKFSRIVAPSLSEDMFKYVLMGVLLYEKQLATLINQQRNRIWKKPKSVQGHLSIGVLGLGELGGYVAEKLYQLGYKVLGYSKRPKKITGVDTFSEEGNGFLPFLEQTNLLINLLPLTPETTHILNKSSLGRLQKGAFLVNVARGGHLIEEDLIQLLQNEHLSGALLDVFEQEPLPPNHPFWDHPNIWVTPHIASVTNQVDAAKIIAENYRRMKKGLPILFEVNPTQGY